MNKVCIFLLIIITASCNEAVVKTLGKSGGGSSSSSGKTLLKRGATIHAICHDQLMEMTHFKTTCQDDSCELISTINQTCTDAGLFMANMKSIDTGSFNNFRRHNLLKYRSNDVGMYQKDHSFYLNDTEVHQIIKEYYLTQIGGAFM
jgi:hypothetical protein